MRRPLLAVSLFTAGLVAADVGGGPVSTVSAVPPGFSDVEVANVGSATAIEALPDGRMIVLEKSGGVVAVDRGAGGATTTRLATFGDLCTGSEQGLLGFTPDPDFVTDGTVYVYRTVRTAGGGCQNRVSRFRMDRNVLDLGSEVVLVDAISARGGNHNGGDIEIGNDGFLYVAIGDAGTDPRGDSGGSSANDAARDLSLLNGKILRVDRTTGVAAPGNPFTGAGTADCRLRGNGPGTPGSACREIFAFGLRNPYRFAFDPNTSATRFFINDVGQNAREEVNDGRPGADYGWNLREGQCPRGQHPPCAGPPAGVTDPITDYRNPGSAFITGGAFVPNGVWPAEFDVGYLFGDGGLGEVWFMNGIGGVDYGAPFMEGKFGLVDMTFGLGSETGALWYARTDGSVGRVVPLPVEPPADSGPLRYDPLPSMQRRFDSREQDPPAPIRAGNTRLLDVGAPEGARAALVNLTLVRPATDGAFATVYRPRAALPLASNVNAPGASVVGNASIVPLDDDGRLQIFVQVTTGVVIDVAGFFVDAPGPVAAGRFEATTPSRIVDTRPETATGEFSTAPSGGGVRVTIPVAGRGGLPDDPAEIGAAVVTLAGINNTASSGGFATALPAGADLPLASSVNVNAVPDVRANLAVVPVASDGAIEVQLEGVDHLTVDVVGWFTGDASPSSAAGRFHLVPPGREADTRVALGPAGLGEADTAVGLDPSVAPATASAIAQNLTLATSGARGFVSAYPGTDRPVVSSINASDAGQIRGALGLVGLDGGAVTIYSEQPNGIVVDSFGWFE